MNKFSLKILGVALCASLLACGSDDDNKVTGGAAEETNIFAMDTVVVTGVSQKGPFVTGSVVTLQELDGITFNQTGNSFKGKIKSDKGDFSVTGINLSSPYAMLEASGYYRDEISGKKSSGTITLNAITDLSNRKTVNINLLTHLEFERVLELVGKKKVPIVKAKAQAEKEIFESFGIDGEFAESEDLNIFKSGDENAALLAVSVLLQSDVDVAGLTERIGNFSIGFAESGTWDDADTKAKIADWACNADLRETLANVRKNIEGWKYADSVPAFEKYVTNFWWDNYGLGTCSKKNDGEVKKNINKLSELYEEYFTCENGRWIIPGEEKSDVKDDEKSNSSKKDDVKSSSSKKEEAKSSSSVKKDEAPTSSSSAASSSSIYNPFAPDETDTIPELPERLSFIDEVFSKSGYLSFGGGLQEVWFLDVQGGGSSVYRDSLAEELVRKMGENDFTYEGDVLNDSISWIYHDTSYIYTLNEDDLTYKIAITRVDNGGAMLCFYGLNLKVVVLKDGFEEQPTTDKNSLRYQSDLPEEVAFVSDSASSKNLAGWSDDSLTTLWYVRHTTETVPWTSYEKEIDPEKEKVALDSLEEFKKVLLEKGFEYVKSDSLSVNDHAAENGYTRNVYTCDSIVHKDFYEKETFVAKYEIVVYVGIQTRTYLNPRQQDFMYGYSVEVRTYYKKE